MGPFRIPARMPTILSFDSSCVGIFHQPLSYLACRLNVKVGLLAQPNPSRKMTCIICVHKEKRPEIAHSVSTKTCLSRWQVAMKSRAAQTIRPIDNLRQWPLIKSTEFLSTKPIPRDSGRMNFVAAHFDGKWRTRVSRYVRKVRAVLRVRANQRNNIHFSSVQLGTRMERVQRISSD